MTTEVYRYSFSPGVQFEDVESTLVLAILAAQCLHSEAEVRLKASHAVDAAKRTCVVDASTDVGRDFNRLFAGLITRELGADAFSVEQVATPTESAAALV